MKHTGKSLEETIRGVQKKYKNRPSPLVFVNPNAPIVPQQQGTPPTTDLRSHLLAGFKPKQDVFY
jgi:hypothetical protein